MVIRDHAFLGRSPIEIFARDAVLHTVYNVGDDCTGGWQLSGSFAVEHNLVGCVADHTDGVEHIADSGKRRCLGNHSRSDIDQQLTVRHNLEHADQLDGRVEFIRVMNILERNIADAFHINILGINVLAQYKRSKYTYFAAGVVSVDISGGIALRIA